MENIQVKDYIEGIFSVGIGFLLASLVVTISRYENIYFFVGLGTIYTLIVLYKFGAFKWKKRTRIKKKY